VRVPPASAALDARECFCPPQPVALQGAQLLERHAPEEQLRSPLGSPHPSGSGSVVFTVGSLRSRRKRDRACSLFGSD
jgi:hypothetical protein